MSKRAVVVLRACLGLGLVLLCAAGCNECLLDEHIEELAGDEARNCGYVPVDASRAGVDACTVNSLEGGEAFYAQYEVRGEHSILTQALIRNREGEVWWLTLDTNPGGEDQVGPRIVRRRCVGPFVDEAFEPSVSAEPSRSRFVNCLEIGEPDIICAQE